MLCYKPKRGPPPQPPPQPGGGATNPAPEPRNGGRGPWDEGSRRDFLRRPFTLIGFHLKLTQMDNVVPLPCKDKVPEAIARRAPLS